MRNVIKLIAVLFIISGCSAYTKAKSNTDDFIHIYNFNKMSKNALFDKSLAWVAESFRSANSVIQLKDKENGKIIGKGIGVCNYILWNREYSFTLIIDVKDNKSRIIFDKIQPENSLQPDPLGGKPAITSGMDIQYQEMYDLVKTNLNNLAASYEKYILKIDKDNF